MNLNEIINAAADEADDFLSGVGSVSDAKPIIVEWLNEHHPALAPADRQKVVQGLIGLLDREGFFDSSGGGDAWDDDGPADESDE